MFVPTRHRKDSNKYITSKKLLPLLLPSFEVSNTENEVHGVLRLLLLLD